MIINSLLPNISPRACTMEVLFFKRRYTSEIISRDFPRATYISRWGLIGTLSLGRSFPKTATQTNFCLAFESIANLAGQPCPLPSALGYQGIALHQRAATFNQDGQLVARFLDIHHFLGIEVLPYLCWESRG